MFSLFGSKCSPRRGTPLKRVFSPATENDSLDVEMKTFTEKMEEEKSWYHITDPLIIDKCSRFGFPLTFFAFNCIYWLVYGNI